MAIKKKYENVLKTNVIKLKIKKYPEMSRGFFIG